MNRLTGSVLGCLVLGTLIVGGGPPAAATPAVVPPADRQVSFVVDGTTTYGVVHVPAHAPGARLAAALLLPGSGPLDRDGNAGTLGVTPATLKLIAGVLGGDGVLSLRFDKYFTGRTGGGRYAHEPGRLDFDAYTRQAAAGYALLAAQPEADPAALLIAGHSEGALQALLVAARVRPVPAGVALLEPQDLRLLDLIDFQLNDQIDQLVTAGRLTPQRGDVDKAALVRAIAAFRAGRPVDTAGMDPSTAAFLQGLFGPLDARFVRSDDAVYPPAVARRLRAGTRVLLTCGTNDVQVPCWTTGPETTALAAARTTGPGLVPLLGLDHFLHPRGTPVDRQVLDSSAQQALHQFARPWHRTPSTPAGAALTSAH